MCSARDVDTYGWDILSGEGVGRVGDQHAALADGAVTHNHQLDRLHCVMVAAISVADDDASIFVVVGDDSFDISFLDAVGWEVHDERGSERKSDGSIDAAGALLQSYPVSRNAILSLLVRRGEYRLVAESRSWWVWFVGGGDMWLAV